MNVTDYRYKKPQTPSNDFHLFNRVDGSDKDWVVIIDRSNTDADHHYGGILGSKVPEEVRALTQEEVAQFRMLAFPDII